MGQQKIIKCAILYTEYLLTWFPAFFQVSHFLKNFNTMKMIRGCSGSRNSFLAVILSQIGIYFLVGRWWQFQQEMEDGGWFLKPLFLLLFKYTIGPNYKVGFDFLVVDQSAASSRNQFFVMPVSCLHLFQLIKFTCLRARNKTYKVG